MKRLAQLESSNEFVRRHIGPDSAQCKTMLSALGLPSIDALIDEAIPAAIRSESNSAEPNALPSGMSEPDTITELRRLAELNRPIKSMIGMGYYGTHTPGVILRNVLENPGWYTAYTPYQAEVSQGRLEALLNYQQMVIDLTGMELANASLLDEATAAAEAMAMAKRVAKNKSDQFIVDSDCHPQTLAVLQTRAEWLGITLVVGDASELVHSTDAFAALVQYPGANGRVRPLAELSATLHDQKALLCVATDLLALCLLESPGYQGADVVFGSAQRFGVPLGYGGPHAAFFATRDVYKRSTPGRIIGVSIDRDGRSALRMALQTREQHIRREKATSNICTAQVLLANISGFYAVYHGPEGLVKIAQRVHRLTCILAQGAKSLGANVEHDAFFDTIAVRAPGRARAIVAHALEHDINLREVNDDLFAMSCDETTTAADIEAIWQAMAHALEVDGATSPSIDQLDESVGTNVPESLQRNTPFLEHPVFHQHRSETEMLRYLRLLQSKDLALDRTMIPLGSCTMKLNATTEMEPVTWPEFGQIHPFAPIDQAQGYRELCQQLEDWLCALTGFDAVSLQPNAGSQGEYAGLLSIRRYLDAKGEGHRNVCLIPASAHGTNPASAQMAGMRVMVVACDDDGNIDFADLKQKAEAHAEKLAALMITYPSTHGVFEEAVIDICAAIHDNGGQVYMDGANLNAMLGVSKPAEIGADVSHMNLHKTFCIPHGGGGPGMGPIGVRAHLAPFLPDHPVVAGVNPAEDDRPAGAAGVGAISAAPWGSASILPISWAYIALMGGAGLRQATEVAILSANYIATRLNEHFPVLYAGRKGRVGHECIVDLRPVKASCGISVDDVAKRLVDYGFHAPTMSFPVADTLMIEPTESEPLKELDRFCDAMIKIRDEIRKVENGEWTLEDNPLVNAPHTADELFADWSHGYSKDIAFYPYGHSRTDKYWPPVARIDNVHGDKNLICTCPPMSDYEEAAE